MRSPNKNGSSISDVECQYDAYLLTARGLSRSTRNLHHHVVHRLLSSRFPSGDIDWSKVRFNDFVQFLTRPKPIQPLLPIHESVKRLSNG
jgi:hypothetical protein